MWGTTLILYLFFAQIAMAQAIISGPAQDTMMRQECLGQLSAAQKHIQLVVQRRDRDEQTIAELVVRIEMLQQEVDRLKNNAQKSTDTP